ncbi:MAG TPA: type II glyceraldehyde-3-phosphate dehydrogenase [Thermoplasmata archaeon]|nr:type II glyceraldehyde-3-phosphate dehydrogenase [Thermoplasmata archaeon]
MALRVGVNGYGTIGKRVADAVSRQPDMTLVGIAKTRPSFEATNAVRLGQRLFIAGTGKESEFEAAHLPVAGTIQDLLKQVDVIVDCTPEGVGRENARVYKEAGVRAIFQGGEKADVAEVSFNALANFAAAKGKHSVRVVSCNSTGLARAAAVLEHHFGVEDWVATIVRRAADPSESRKGPINGILPTFKLPSHHGPDVRTIFATLPIVTTAVVVPTTLMHVHVNRVRLRNPPKDRRALAEAFRTTARFHLFAGWEGVEGTPQVMEFAKDRGLGRSDMMENALWEEGIELKGQEAYFFQAIHQESIVVPENIDAIRAMFNLAPDGALSIAMTDKSLGIPAPPKAG